MLWTPTPRDTAGQDRVEEPLDRVARRLEVAFGQPRNVPRQASVAAGPTHSPRRGECRRYLDATTDGLGRQCSRELGTADGLRVGNDHKAGEIAVAVLAWAGRPTRGWTSRSAQSLSAMWSAIG